MFSAPFVPDPERYTPEQLRHELSTELGPPTSSSGNHAFFDAGDATVQLTTMLEPTVYYILVQSPDPTVTDDALARVAQTVAAADLERIKRGATGDENDDDIGWLQLWAVAWLGEPSPSELEDVIWEAVASSDFIERLRGTEAAHILGTEEARLAIEVAALVEVGPIRATFESYLVGTSRRSPSRERRYLLDPSKPLEEALHAVDGIARTRPGTTVRSRSGALFVLVEWMSDDPPLHIFVLDCLLPRLRLVGVSDPSKSEPVQVEELEIIELRTALERAREGQTDWLRAAANAMDPREVDAFMEIVDQTLDVSPTARREAALAAIEAGRPELRAFLEGNLDRFEDEELFRTIRVALG